MEINLPQNYNPIVVSIQQENAPVHSVVAHGAVGDGVSDDTAAIQMAIDAAIADRGVVLIEPRTYKITDTLTIHNVDAFLMGGVGGGSSTGPYGAVLDWHGAADRPATRLASCRNSHVENLRVTASTPLMIGVEIKRVADGTINPARNTISNVEVNGITDRLGTGFVVSCDTGYDANNDFNKFDNCVASNYGTANGAFVNPAGFSIQHSQSLGNIMLNCHASASATGMYGCTNGVGSGALGSFHWIGGGISNNAVSDFYIGVGSGGVSIEKVQAEGSAHFLKTTGPGLLEMPVSIRNCRYHPRSNLATDNRWIDYRLQGGLVLDNCQFGAYTAEDAGQIYVSGSSSDSACIVIGGNYKSAANTFFAGTGTFYIMAALHLRSGEYNLVDYRPSMVTIR